jgi:hypothetical protein
VRTIHWPKIIASAWPEHHTCGSPGVSAHGA